MNIEKNARHSLRFAALIRVSTERQEERGESLRTQEKEIEEAVQRLGGEITVRYGGQQHATPGHEHGLLDDLLRDAPTGKFDAVIVTKTDRWSRDVVRGKQARDLLQRHRIRFFVGSVEHDLNSPEAALVLGFFDQINEYVARINGRESVKNRVERARRGWLMTGTAPYGRRIANPSPKKEGQAQWEIIAQEQELVLRAYHLYVESGKTFAEVGPLVGMSAETVRRRLLFGCGDRLVQRFRSEDGTIDEIVETQIPPLLTLEMIAAVASRAKENQVHRTQQHEYPLAHIVRCSHCGSVFSGQGNVRKNGTVMRYYQHFADKMTDDCTSYVRADQIERAVFGQIGDLLKNKRNALRANVALALAEQQGKQHDAKRDLEAAEGEYARLLRERGKLIDSITRFDIEEGSSTHQEIKRRITEVERKLAGNATLRQRLEQAARLAVIPADLHERVSAALFHLIGLNGAAPLTWPASAQKELAKFFFGSSVKRDPGHGIFVHRREHARLGRYWTYEARGFIGFGRGALSDYTYLHDIHDEVEPARALEPHEGVKLARIAAQLPDPGADVLKRPAYVYTHVLNRGGRGVVSPLDR